MPTLIIGDERNLSDLRSRLFTRNPSSARLRTTRSALEAANPGVNLNRLRPGMVLAIPDIPEITRRDRNLDNDTRSAVDQIGDRLEEAIDEFRQHSRTALARNKERRGVVSEAVGSSALDRAARRDRRLSSELKAVRTGVAKEAELDAARAEATNEAVQRWKADLETIKGLLPD